MDQRHCTWLLNQELDAAIDAHKQAVKDYQWVSTAGMLDTFVANYARRVKERAERVDILRYRLHGESV